MVQQDASALLVMADPFLNNRREQIVALALDTRSPAIYEWREIALAGGLMSYGSSLIDAYRQLGIYAGRILRGATPADLPIQQAVKVELVLNLKTAKRTRNYFSSNAAWSRRRGNRMKPPLALSGQSDVRFYVGYWG